MSEEPAHGLYNAPCMVRHPLARGISYSGIAFRIPQFLESHETTKTSNSDPEDWLSGKTTGHSSFLEATFLNLEYAGVLRRLGPGFEVCL